MNISIVIPAKNEEDNISQCLKALKSQISEFNEIIVVDNGSTDNTVSIAKLYTDKVYVKPKFSLSELRNYGARKSSGKVIAFLDADCIVSEKWICQIQKTLEDVEIGCTGSTPVAPQNGSWVEAVWSSFRTRRKRKCYTSWINSSNFIVRRDYFFCVGGFNDEVKTCEDVDICMRLNKICKILFDPSINVVHLGEPKTVKQFLLKEIWRGKGTVSGVISHGFVLSELKSLILPVYYLFSALGLVIALFAFGYKYIFAYLALCLFPAFIFAVWMTANTKKINYFFGYLILFLVYASARTIALFAR
ncbi:MAG: glycosyltransferase [Desulfuromonadaceae bacterium]|nr:glycosyltransferase [Desulfuromonadaceae bacterium]